MEKHWKLRFVSAPLRRLVMGGKSAVKQAAAVREAEQLFAEGILL